MAYKFNCTSCKSEITSNYLKPGEDAFCYKCASRMKVPLDAEEVTFVHGLNKFVPPVGNTEEVAPIAGKFSGIKAWNPRWFHGLSTLFSFLPSGILWALNFERFGQPERRLPSMVAVIVGFVAVMAAFSVFEEVPRYVVFFINFGFGGYFYFSQKKQFEDFLAQGGRKASYAIPLAVQVVAAIVIVVSFASSRLDLERERMENVENAIRLFRELDAGNYELVDSLTRDEGSNAGPSIFGATMISRKLIEKGRPDTALAIIETKLRDAPENQDLLALRHLARSHLKKSRGDSKGAIAEVELYLDYEPTDWRTVNLKHEWKDELKKQGQ